MVERVRCGSKTYDVKYQTEPFFNGNSVRNIGQIDYDKQWIKIDATFPDRAQRRTLVHESMHGISDDYGIDLTHEQVEKLECGLCAFIRDNKEFIYELLEEE